MLKIKEYEAKTEEDAILKAITDQNCQREDLFVEVTYEEGKLFKGAKYKVRTIHKEVVNEFILHFCKQLGEMMGLELVTELHYQGDTVTVSLNSDQNAILIGKDGRTLNSIQIVLRQAIRKEINSSLKIMLDVADYKEKKMKNLEREVKKIAHEVVQSGVECSLDPMNSYERRFVHSIVADIAGVKTESVGEGKERHIVIKKVED